MNRKSLCFVFGAIFVLSLSGCSSKAPVHLAGHQNLTSATKSQAKSKTTYSLKKSPSVLVTQISNLPLAVEGDVLAGSKSRLDVVGGYTGNVSTDGVYTLSKSWTERARMPFRIHDAAAGFIDGNLFVFGGGQADSYRTIVKVTNNSSKVTATLPYNLSDAVCVPWSKNGKQGLLLIGGYDGVHFHTSIDFFYLNQGHLSSQSVGALQAGVRYPAVSVLNGQLYIIGGKDKNGVKSNVIYRFSNKDDVAKVANLPIGIEKASSFANGKYVYILGGIDSSGKVSDDIYALDTTTNHISLAGHLPHPLADMGYFQAGSIGYLAGGTTGSKTSNGTYKVEF